MAGVYTWPDGRRYEGGFVNGTQSGRGLTAVQYWPNTGQILNTMTLIILIKHWLNIKKWMRTIDTVCKLLDHTAFLY